MSVKMKSFSEMENLCQPYLLDLSGYEKELATEKATEKALEAVLKGELPGEESDSIDSKYIVKGAEELSCETAKLLTSGRGYYIMGYAHAHRVNRYVSGFNSLEELVHYANWAITGFNESYDETMGEIKELIKVEESMTKEQLTERYLKRSQLMIKVYENIFDFEVKNRYIDEADECITIQYIFETFVEGYKLLSGVDKELKKLEEVN